MSSPAIDRTAFMAIYDAARVPAFTALARGAGKFSINDRMKYYLNVSYGIPYSSLNTMLGLYASGAYATNRIITYSGDFLVDYAGNNITNYGS